MLRLPLHSWEPYTQNEPASLYEHIKGTQIYGEVFILDSGTIW